jgi:cbb3-type cytochrome oxidase maturation protein
MNIIFLTLGVSLAIAVFFLAAFIWATSKGQYDDLETPGHRMLLDDDDTNKKADANNDNDKAKEDSDK